MKNPSCFSISERDKKCQKWVDFGKFSPFVKSKPPFVKSSLFFWVAIVTFETQLKKQKNRSGEKPRSGNLKTATMEKHDDMKKTKKTTGQKVKVESIRLANLKLTTYRVIKG